MLFKLLITYTKMIFIPNKVPRKKRVFLGPLSRKILKLSNWEITGEFPNYKKIILLKLGGIPVYRNKSKGLIKGAIEEFQKWKNTFLQLLQKLGQSRLKNLEVDFII